MDELDLVRPAYALTPELEAEKKELKRLISKSEDWGFLFEVHLEPLAGALNYLKSDEGITSFYELVSDPGEDYSFSIEVLDNLLKIYAGRQEALFVNGLKQRKVASGPVNSYCAVELLPLVEGPSVRGLEDIFGKEDSIRISSDIEYIPVDKTYVCCCHNMSKNKNPSIVFLLGDEKIMSDLIPGALEISDEISMEELCPYKVSCPLKNAYNKAAANGASLRIINSPLENSLGVLRARIETALNTEAYDDLILAAAKMNEYNDHIEDPYNLNGKEPDTSYIG